MFSLKHLKCIVTILLAVPVLCPAQDQLIKYERPLGTTLRSFGQESVALDPPSGSTPPQFVSVGNVRETTGVLKPVVTLVDALTLNAISSNTIEYIPGLSQSANTVCTDPRTGHIYMGMSLFFAGKELAYLIKMDASGTVLWGHRWGEGRIHKLIYNDISKQIVVFGHLNNGRLLVAGLDPTAIVPGLLATYVWRWEDELLDGGAQVPLTPRDMTIDRASGDIVVLAHSRYSGDDNICVFHHKASGAVNWGYDYGRTPAFEQARAICIGPGTPSQPYTITVAGDVGDSVFGLNLDPLTGNVNWRST